jgi:hypothetical protein
MIFANSAMGLNFCKLGDGVKLLRKQKAESTKQTAGRRKLTEDSK